MLGVDHGGQDFEAVQQYAPARPMVCFDASSLTVGG